MESTEHHAQMYTPILAEHMPFARQRNGPGGREGVRCQLTGVSRRADAVDKPQIGDGSWNLGVGVLDFVIPSTFAFSTFGLGVSVGALARWTSRRSKMGTGSWKLEVGVSDFVIPSTFAFSTFVIADAAPGRASRIHRVEKPG